MAIETEEAEEGKDEGKAIFSKVAGAKDVVPRTAIDLIRALPTLFPPSFASLPLRLGWTSSSDFHLPLAAFLFSIPVASLSLSFSLTLTLSYFLRISFSVRFSSLTTSPVLLHHCWQPAYRQSSFSILRGGAPLFGARRSSPRSVRSPLLPSSCP